jgi:hypothetical protein
MPKKPFASVFSLETQPWSGAQDEPKEPITRKGD